MFSLSQAAKHTGKSKSVISRALDNGRITALKNEDGSYAIEPDELFSVFPEKNESTGTSTASSNATGTHENTREQPVLPTLEALTAQQAGQVDDLRAMVTDLQTRLDAAETDRRQLEADRRQAGESSTRQIEQLSQLLAAEKQEKQALKIEHKPDESIVADLRKKIAKIEAERQAEVTRNKNLTERLKQAEPKTKPGLFTRIFA